MKLAGRAAHTLISAPEAGRPLAVPCGAIVIECIVGVLGDPFEFGDAADVGRIGTDDPAPPASRSTP